MFLYVPEKIILGALGSKSSEVIICLDSAAAVLGFGNGFGIPVQFFSNLKDNLLKSSYLEPILVDDLGEYSGDVINIGGVRCTNIQRTICDLISYDECKQVLDEVLSDYLFTGQDMLELCSMAERFGIKDKLDEEIEWAKLCHNRG